MLRNTLLNCQRQNTTPRMAGRDGGAVAGRGKQRAADVRPHRCHEGIESSRRTRVRPVAEGQALGTTEVGAGSMTDVPRHNSVMASIALMRSCTVAWRFFFSSQRRPIANCLKSFLS